MNSAERRNLLREPALTLRLSVNFKFSSFALHRHESFIHRYSFIETLLFFEKKVNNDALSCLLWAFVPSVVSMLAVSADVLAA